MNTNNYQLQVTNRKKKKKNLKPACLTFIHPVWDAVEDAADLTRVGDPVHGLEVRAGGVVHIVVRHEGQGVVGGRPGGEQQRRLIAPVPDAGRGQRYTLPGTRGGYGVNRKLL